MGMFDNFKKSKEISMEKDTSSWVKPQVDEVNVEKNEPELLSVDLEDDESPDTNEDEESVGKQTKEKYESIKAFAMKHEWLLIDETQDDDDCLPTLVYLTRSAKIISIEINGDDMRLSFYDDGYEFDF